MVHTLPTTTAIITSNENKSLAEGEGKSEDKKCTARTDAIENEQRREKENKDGTCVKGGEHGNNNNLQSDGGIGSRTTNCVIARRAMPYILCV